MPSKPSILLSVHLMRWEGMVAHKAIYPADLSMLMHPHSRATFSCLAVHLATHTPSLLWEAGRTPSIPLRSWKDSFNTSGRLEGLLQYLWEAGRTPSIPLGSWKDSFNTSGKLEGLLQYL